MSKQDRQGVRTPADIERKYDLGRDFSEIEKQLSNAQRTAASAKSTADNAASMAGEAAQAVESMGSQVTDLSERVDTLEQSGVGGGTSFTTDETLTLKDGVLSVNRATAVEEDNTLPITSAAVFTEIGNIDVLLQTI